MAPHVDGARPEVPARADETARRLAQVEEMVARTHERAAELYEAWLDRQAGGPPDEFQQRVRLHRETASAVRSGERLAPRVLRAFEERIAALPNVGEARHLVVLAALARLRMLTDRRIEETVAAGRRSGATWTQIAAALGVTRQTAHQRYRDRSRVREP
jgi:hypothetical protein